MEEFYCAEQQLCRLRQNAASSSSAAAMAGALESVARVYEHVGSLVRFACADQVEEELEESVALLDACAAARDSLRAMRACALDLEKQLRTLGDTIQLLEDGLELLFRRLVQCRVFLLNMCSS
uniref:Uncharacterized protein n=1 Tax=Oryza brachyantha TaxID=4533 RepID=J3MV41_ORYBR